MYTQNNEVYCIRGHHWGRWVDFHRRLNEKLERSKCQEQNQLKRFIREVESDYLREQIKKLEDDKQGVDKELGQAIYALSGMNFPEYATDTWGINADDNTSHINKLAEHRLNLYQLPSEHPVVVGSIKDGLCEACNRGEHCNRLKVSIDNVGTKRFINDLRVYNLDLYVPKNFRTIEIPESDVFSLRYHTNVGVIREVLDFMVNREKPQIPV